MSERIPSGPPPPQGAGEDPLTHWTRIFTRFLQVLFGTFDKGSYKWEDDAQLSDIIIQGEGTVDREVVEKRPAIIIARGPAAFGNVSLDQFKAFDYYTGRRSHTDLISAVMTYNVLAPEGLEAQRIAWISAYATRAFKRTLMHLGLHRVGEELSIGAESPPGALVPGNPTEIILVPVSVPFYFQNSWSVEPQDKVLLNAISVNVKSEVASPAPGATVIRDPAIYGRVLGVSQRISLDSKVKVPPTGPRPRK